MSRFLEQSADGFVLEWRPHDLADVAALRGLPDLEPVLLTGERSQEGLLAIEADHRGLRWSWSGWESLEMIPAGGDTTAVRRAAEPPAIGWPELGDPYAVETTPRRADGTVGTTRLIERPRPCVVFALRDELLVVRVEGAVAAGRIRAELFELGDYKQLRATGDGQELRRRGADLEAILDPGRSFFGVVAVVESLGARRRVMDWRPWVEGRLLSRKEATVETNLRREVERTGPPTPDAKGSFAAWPRRSRERLEWIAARAAWLADGTAGSAWLGRISGAFRAVFLAELGVAPEPPSTGLAGRLEGGSFFAALGHLWPLLPARLQETDNASARLWLLRHAEDPSLIEVAKTGGNDAARLDRALSAADWRERLDRLAGRLREGCPELRQVESLREELQRYVEEGGALGGAPTEIIRFEERLAREAARQPVPDDPPPLTPERHAAWLQMRSVRIAWRQRLVRIVAYCETGTWDREPPPPANLATPEALLDLRHRLSRIMPPPQPRQTDAGMAAVVQREIDSLETGAAAEGDQELRREALSLLRATVRPHAGDWAGLRRDLDAAERLRPAHPWLAEQIPAAPAGSPLAERGKAALRFLSLLHGVEQRAAQWNGTGSGVDAQWQAILEAPDHPQLQILIREILEMRRSLSPGARTADPDLPAPPVPADPGPEARLEAWWQYLEKLVPLHAELTQRFAAAHRDWEAYSPVLEPVRGIVDFWRQQPAAERPGYFVELAELTDRAYTEGAARPQAQMRLIELMISHPTIRDDWQQAAARAGATARSAARTARKAQQESEERA